MILPNYEGTKLLIRNTFCAAIKVAVLFSCLQTVLAEDGAPTGVVFHIESHRHLHFNRADGHGDNWCQTWARDGNIYTFADDGFGWIPRDQRRPPEYPEELAYSCRLWKITDGIDHRTVADLPNQPEFSFPTKWFGFGVISVDGTLYGTITHVGGPGVRWNRPFNGFKLIYSSDLGQTWYLHDGRALGPGERAGLSRSMKSEDNLFWQEDPTKITDRRGVTETGHAFTSVYPVQCGQDNGLAKDDYVYWYAPDVPAHRLNLARVHKRQITDRTKWVFFREWNGTTPVWTSNIDERGAVIEYPQHHKEWVACWRGNKPSVVYNAGLEKYIMINWIEYKTAYWNEPRRDKQLGVKSYAIALHHADNPFGPWTEFYWNPDFKPGERDYSIYHPQLSPKWIEDGGKTMTMVFTSRSSYGASGNVKDYLWPQQADYAWNEMRITIETDSR